MPASMAPVHHRTVRRPRRHLTATAPFFPTSANAPISQSQPPMTYAPSFSAPLPPISSSTSSNTFYAPPTSEPEPESRSVPAAEPELPLYDPEARGFDIVRTSQQFAATGHMVSKWNRRPPARPPAATSFPPWPTCARHRYRLHDVFFV